MVGEEVDMANGRKRGAFLTVMAVLLGVLALSNFTKALQYLRDPTHLGIVILGVRFESVPSNLILGPLTGAVLAAYAYGLWSRTHWVVPLAMVYAFYVPVNLVLFWYRQVGPEIPPLGFILLYLAISLTGSVGTALYVAYHHDRFA